MLHIDLNGPMSLEPRLLLSGRISRPVRFAAPAILFLTCAAFCATISRAQDQSSQSVADAARQERARKQERQKTAKHVYTEEDLKHPNILTPEDRAIIEAKKKECAEKNNCAPSQNPPDGLDANAKTPDTSLGEVARRLRIEKELEALKPKQSEPFHLPVEGPTFASPILPVLPLTPPSAQPARPKISSLEFFSPRITSRKISPAKPPANIFRRDPFSGMPAPPKFRQPEIARPEVVRPKMNGNVHPTLPSNAHPKTSADGALKISGAARPKVGNDLLPVVPPASVRPDFSQTVRPAVRAHRIIVPAQPKMSSRPTTPNTLLRSAEPVAPTQPEVVAKSVAPTVVAKPIVPVAPATTVRPTQPTLGSLSAASGKTIRVQSGDSLWKLAQKNLGSGLRYPEILSVNPAIVNANQIRAGAELVLPTVTDRKITAQPAANTITVHKGDTLWSLAKSNLGKASAWTCIASSNPALTNPDRIYEGQALLLPSSCFSVEPVR